MKTVIIGPGSMGLLYGAKLSKAADAALIGNNAENIRLINQNGVTVKRGDTSAHYDIPAYFSGEYRDKADLIILFTKGYITKTALEQNRDIIGNDTVILTLQNGAGHESVLREFADDRHILIGTTQQGSSRENAYTVINSGLGDTVFGSLSSDFTDAKKYTAVFEKVGFPCAYSGDIYNMIWNKLMINASSSVLSGVLQVNQGYIAEDAAAWEACQKLISEICDAAAANGYIFDKQEQYDRIYTHLKNAPDGFTSIYADLKYGRKTEVDSISGAVVRAAEEKGISLPNMEAIVKKVHEMEGGICK
jgi:2-dehydropantoate 2-reductase